MNNNRGNVMYRTFILLSCFLTGILFGQTKEDDITLTDVYEMSIEDLMNIQVETASRKKENIHEAPATMIVITDRQIKERGYQNLYDVLKDLPGIDLVNVHGVYPVLWAPRGAMGDENKRTLLMIDGVVENNIWEGNVLGGPQYSIHNVKQIEIIYGPASALYGANAFSAIINIITKKGKDINGFSVQAGIGSENTKLVKFMLGSKTSNGLDFSLSGSVYKTDGPTFSYRHPGYNNSYVDKAFSVVGRISYKNTTLGFSRFDRPMGYGQFSNSSAEYYGLPLYGYENSEGKTVPGVLAPINIHGEKPGLSHPVSNTVFLKSFFPIFEQESSSLIINTKAFYRFTEMADDSYVYSLPLFKSDPAPKYYRWPYTHYSYTGGGEIYGDYTMNENNNLIMGVLYETTNVEEGYRGQVPPEAGGYKWSLTPERKFNIYHNYSLFSQYRLKTKLLNYTGLTLGARYDSNSVYGDTFNPRGGIVSKPIKNLTLKVLAGTAFRAPTSQESFSETENDRIANPDLAPEKVVTYEMGIGYRIVDNWLFEINGYRNELTDMIVSNVPIGDLNNDGDQERQNRNVGKAVLMGIEIKNTFKLGSSFSGFASATIQEGKQKDNKTDEDEEYDIPNIAKYKGNIGITMYLFDHTSLYVVGHYVGERTTAESNPRDHVDGYFSLDMSLLSKKFFHDKLDFSLRINNVLNTSYGDPGIRSANGNNYPTQMQYPGRNFLFNIEVKH